MMGSGSATHNLRALVRGQHDAEPEPWAKAFDDWLAETLEKGDEAALATIAPRRRMPATPIRPMSISCRCTSPSARQARARTDARSIAASPSGNLSMASYAFA